MFCNILSYCSKTAIRFLLNNTSQAKSDGCGFLSQKHTEAGLIQPYGRAKGRKRVTHTVRWNNQSFCTWTVIIELKHLTFGFVPEKQILKELSFSLEGKKVYALMGGNGAGKTTLFNLITGFIKPQSGEILLNGKNLAHQQPYTINRQGIGRTFQDLRLITKLTVKRGIYTEWHPLWSVEMSECLWIIF